MEQFWCHFHLKISLGTMLELLMIGSWTIASVELYLISMFRDKLCQILSASDKVVSDKSARALWDTKTCIILL